MMLDQLQRARAQCIVYYICNGDELFENKNGNYEERGNKTFDKYRKSCKQFADRICDTMAHYERLDDNRRSMLIDSFKEKRAIAYE